MRSSSCSSRGLGEADWSPSHRATTHTDLLLRADALSIPYTVIHNASVMNAVGAVGLALYNYGQTVSIPFFTENWRPDSWLERIRENMDLGLHTLCLVDIKVKEQTEENLMRSVQSNHSLDCRARLTCESHFRGRKIFEPPRYMSIPTAISQLLEALSKPPPAPSDDPDDPPPAVLPVHKIPLSPSSTLAISLSRVGDPSQKFISGTLEEMSHLDEEAFGPPLHSFVIVGRQFHALERDFAARWAIDRENFMRVSNEVYAVRD